MLKHASHEITNTDIKSVIKVLKSDFITQGPEIESLERKINFYRFKIFFSSEQ